MGRGGCLSPACNRNMPSEWLSLLPLFYFVDSSAHSFLLARPVPEYAKSCMYVARHQTTAVDGDLELAREYLERVATSNSEEVGQATELLKKVKGMLVAKTHAEVQTKAAVEDSAGPSKPESGGGPPMATE